MRDLVQLGSSQQKPLKTPEQKSGLRARRPEWMRVKIQNLLSSVNAWRRPVL